jgi:hypothetical protein
MLGQPLSALIFLPKASAIVNRAYLPFTTDISWIMGLIHLTRVSTTYVCSCVREIAVASILFR